MSRVQFDLSICVTYYGRKTSRPKTQILDPNFTFPLAKWSQVMLRGPANDHQMIARRWTRRTFGPFLLAQSPEHFLRLNRLKIDFGKVKNGSTPFCLGLNHRVVRKKKGGLLQTVVVWKKDCRRPRIGGAKRHSYTFLMVGIIWVSCSTGGASGAEWWWNAQSFCCCFVPLVLLQNVYWCRRNPISQNSMV